MTADSRRSLGAVKFEITGPRCAVGEAMNALGADLRQVQYVDHSEPAWRSSGFCGYTDGDVTASGYAEIRSAGPVAASVKPAEPKPSAAFPACSGSVTLVSDDGSERYGSFRRISGDIVVEWHGLTHRFLLDGTCEESEKGAMRGWRIHPDELARFQAQLGKSSVGERVVVAPDGEDICVAERKERESGVPAWVVRIHGLRFTRVYAHNPTDAEVLADYAAWKAAR